MLFPETPSPGWAAVPSLDVDLRRALIGVEPDRAKDLVSRAACDALAEVRPPVASSSPSVVNLSSPVRPRDDERLAGRPGPSSARRLADPRPHPLTHTHPAQLQNRLEASRLEAEHAASRASSALRDAETASRAHASEKADWIANHDALLREISRAKDHVRLVRDEHAANLRELERCRAETRAARDDAAAARTESARHRDVAVALRRQLADNTSALADAEARAVDAADAVERAMTRNARAAAEAARRAVVAARDAETGAAGWDVAYVACREELEATRASLAASERARRDAEASFAEKISAANAREAAAAGEALACARREAETRERAEKAEKNAEEAEARERVARRAAEDANANPSKMDAATERELRDAAEAATRRADAAETRAVAAEAVAATLSELNRTLMDQIARVGIGNGGGGIGNGGGVDGGGVHGGGANGSATESKPSPNSSPSSSPKPSPVPRRTPPPPPPPPPRQNRPLRVTYDARDVSRSAPRSVPRSAPRVRSSPPSSPTSHHAFLSTYPPTSPRSTPDRRWGRSGGIAGYVSPASRPFDDDEDEETGPFEEATDENEPEHEHASDADDGTDGRSRRGYSPRRRDEGSNLRADRRRRSPGREDDDPTSVALASMEAEVRAMDEEYRECLEEIRRGISEGGRYTVSDARWDARTDALAGRANALEDAILAKMEHISELRDAMGESSRRGE